MSGTLLNETSVFIIEIEIEIELLGHLGASVVKHLPLAQVMIPGAPISSFRKEYEYTLLAITIEAEGISCSRTYKK